MKKNRIIITIWMAIISLIILSMIIYVIYAAKNNPYFGNNAPSFQTIMQLLK